MSGETKAAPTEVWDEQTQQPHGGQEWKFLENFVSDFSVTTNALGPPPTALDAARAAIDDIHHYPPADMEPARSDLARFLWPTSWREHLPSLLLGNGASELIDLIVRDSPPGPWKPGQMLTQYKEYERSALAAGRWTVDWDDPEATLTCMVNPTNPTGDFWNLDTMQRYVEERCRAGSALIVDESMLPWLGSQWRDESVLGERARPWVERMREERGLAVWVMVSWTKIWSCTGLRIGSVVAPTSIDADRVRKRQVPWSVNVPALAFLSAAVQDQAYLERTWEVTPGWRRHLVAGLRAQHPSWKIYGEEFLSWIWIDTRDTAQASAAEDLARAAGLPIRHGRPGYDLPTFIRLAVREPEHSDALLAALAAIPSPPAD